MKAVIAGVTGAVGGAVARELASSGDWTVAGLSRSPPKSPVAGVEYLSADLAEPSGAGRRSPDTRTPRTCSTAPVRPTGSRRSRTRRPLPVRPLPVQAATLQLPASTSFPALAGCRWAALGAGI